jgi:hypothetical protein
MERRETRRFDLHLPVQYRVSQRGGQVAAGSGTTKEISISGLSFRCRRTLPVGSHIEVVVDWPVRYADLYPIDLLLTGFVVRADATKAAIRITSRRFRVAQMAEAYPVSA